MLLNRAGPRSSIVTAFLSSGIKRGSYDWLPQAESFFDSSIQPTSHACVRLSPPDLNFDTLLLYKPIVMHRPLPPRVLKLKVEAHHHFRKQLVDFHQADVLAQADAIAFSKLWSMSVRESSLRWMDG